MAKRRKKGPSHTPKAEDRHWYGDRQDARAAKRGGGTGKPRPAQSSSGTRGGVDRPARDSDGGRSARDSGGGQRTASSRGRQGAGDGPELVAGRNPVVEALRARVPATALYVHRGGGASGGERVREAMKLATDRQVPLLDASKPELDRLTDGAVHQGIALQVKPYDYAHPDDLLTTSGSPLIVALDGVTDPRNLGAVVRSAAAFGAHGVVVPERRAAGVTAGAWKTSAGTLASMPVARATNLVRTLKAYQAAGCFVAGLDARGSLPVDGLEIAGDPFVLVVGSEGRGLSRLVAETCDLVVSIPMGSQAESLNAGVAAGIALYEIARLRRAAP